MCITENIFNSVLKVVQLLHYYYTPSPISVRKWCLPPFDHLLGQPLCLLRLKFQQNTPLSPHSYGTENQLTIKSCYFKLVYLCTGHLGTDQVG